MSVTTEEGEEHTITLRVSEQVAQHLKNLPSPTEDLDEKLVALLEAEYRRRLSRYSLTDRLMARKYEMSFVEFEQQRIPERQKYSWEVESDAIEWDLAVSGIRTMQRKLDELLSSATHAHR